GYPGNQYRPPMNRVGVLDCRPGHRYFSDGTGATASRRNSGDTSLEDPRLASFLQGQPSESGVHHVVATPHSESSETKEPASRPPPTPTTTGSCRFAPRRLSLRIEPDVTHDLR